jgi:hypothetical protein
MHGRGIGFNRGSSRDIVWSAGIARTNTDIRVRSVPGVEPSFPTYQSGVLNRWTTGLCFSVKSFVVEPVKRRCRAMWPQAQGPGGAVGMAGLEPTIACSQGTWGAAPLHPALCQWPVRESNPSLRLERAVSFADRRTSHRVRAPGAQSGSGGARILVCGFSVRRCTVSATDPGPKGHRSSLLRSDRGMPDRNQSEIGTSSFNERPERRKPDALVTPGFGVCLRMRPRCHKRRFRTGDAPFNQPKPAG